MAHMLVEGNGEPGAFQQFGELSTLSVPEHPLAESACDSTGMALAAVPPPAVLAGQVMLAALVPVFRCAP
ncbi:MAG: hypothetical protein HQ465_19900 [Rhodospirillales bacterium]|nr:hypothetical protein [Rhodospirillales bacterium]